MFRSLKAGAFTRYQPRPLIIRVLVTIGTPSSRFLNSLAMASMSKPETQQDHFSGVEGLTLYDDTDIIK